MIGLHHRGIETRGGEGAFVVGLKKPPAGVREDARFDDEEARQGCRDDVHGGGC